MKCTDLLFQDHIVILRALDILDRMGASFGKNEPVDPEDTRDVLRFLRIFADEHHQAKEESVLFPQLFAVPGLQHASLRHMLFEHDQERSLIEGLEDALKTKKGPDFRHYAHRLSGILRAHIDKENNILFEIAERSLSQEQHDRIAAEFEKFDLGWENREELNDNLRRLERKYLGIAA
jgi:hemerythrin-like domain-containing protein